jgi:hypothetical protein
MGLAGAWDENDRLRNHLTRLLVDGALSADVALVVVGNVRLSAWPGR